MAVCWLKNRHRFVIVSILSLSFSSILFANELEPVSLKLKWRHQFQFAGFYAAIEKGFYREAGFDVTLVEHQGGSDLYEAVSNGKIEFGLADSSIVVKRLQGLPVVILTTIFQHSPSVLISIKENDVMSPFELVGKRVMFQQNADDASIQAMLVSLGIRSQDYEPIEHNFNDFALIDPDNPVDVMSAYLSNEPYLYKQAGIDVQIIDPANYGVDFYGDLLYTNENYALNYPDRAIAFKEASLKGWEYALANQDEVMNWLLEKYHSQKTLDALNYEAQVIRKMIAADFVPLGSLYPARFERIATIYKQLGLAPEAGTLNGLTLNNYLDSESDKALQLLKLFASIAIVLLLMIGILGVVMRSLRNTIKNRTYELNVLNKALTHQLSLTDQYVFSAALNSDSRFTEVSTALCNKSGYSREELLQTGPETLMPSSDRLAYRGFIRRGFSGRSSQGEIKLIDKNGSFYWLHIYVDPVRNADDQVIGLQFTASDITEKKIIEHLADTDVLTGIANRKKLDAVLEREWKRYIRYKQEVAIILLDLDYFKQVNDKFGHIVGDEVLKIAASLVTDNVRDIDLVGRWGGEEFLVILPQTTLNDASKVALKLRDTLSKIEDFPQLSLTASFGVASSSQVTELKELFRIADKALYAAKEKGRNRVEQAN